MSRERYTLLVEDNDERAKIMEKSLGDAKPEHPILRARSLRKALQIIEEEGGIASFPTIVINPTVTHVAHDERWGKILLGLYTKHLKEHAKRPVAGSIFFDILKDLYPDMKTSRGLLGGKDFLLTSLSPKANEETKSVSDRLHQGNTQTRQALVGNSQVGDDVVIKTFIKQSKSSGE